MEINDKSISKTNWTLWANFFFWKRSYIISVPKFIHLMLVEVLEMLKIEGLRMLNMEGFTLIVEGNFQAQHVKVREDYFHYEWVCP